MSLRRKVCSSDLPLSVGVLLAAVWLATAGQALAQEKNIRFDRLSSDHGLSQADVYAIHQDQFGLMWFGTQDGLNRFDGYDFTHYRHDPFYAESISNSFVYSILEDSEGNLWIGTMGGGLNRWDRSEDTFTHYRHDASDPTSLSNDRIRVLHLDPRGRIWVGTDGGGLNVFDPESGSFSRFTHDPAQPQSLANDKIRAIHRDQNGDLWIGTDGGGLDRFDPAIGGFVHYRDDGDVIGGLDTARVQSIFESGDGALWVGTYDQGLFRRDPTKAVWEQYLHNPENPASLSSNSVRTFFQDDQETLWIGTDSGLDEWKPDSQSFAHYQNRVGDSTSLSDNRVVSIFQDRGGVLWIGSQGGGLNRWSPRAGFFSSYRADPADNSRLSSNIVVAFAQDSDGSPIVGTYGGGVAKLDRSTNTFTTFRHHPYDPGSLSDDRVTSLCVDREGILWVGTLAGGLNRLDAATGKFRRFKEDSKDSTSLSRNGVTTVLDGGDGYLWLGTMDGGLNRLDRQTGTFIQYLHDPENPTSLSDSRVTALYEERSGILWVGTESGGLNRFDRNTGGFTHFRHDPANLRSLSSDTIYSIHEDRESVLWIGTPSGLNRWESGLRSMHQGFFKRYTEREGLPNNSIFAILEDEEGNLWLSSNKGISRFEPDGEVFKNFDVSHGLQSNEFNRGAAFRFSSGELFFGGNQGFNSFFPKKIGKNTYVPPVILTGLLKANQPADVPLPISDLKRIELTHRDHVVSFEFAALDYTAPEKNRYAYMLEGFDSGWNEVGTLRRATYTNLDAGSYVFRVKGSNNDGTWNSHGASLRVDVVPAPWKTKWAYAVYLLGTLYLAFFYLRAQRRQRIEEARRRYELERDVQSRTRELAEKNDTLQYMNKKLEEASYTDALTGLRNRRFLLTSIQTDVAQVDRFYTRLHSGDIDDSSVKPDLLFLLFDLDGFKQINDIHGHAAGDLVLVQVRNILSNACRDSDTLVRWGGDEFLVVGRSTEQEVAEGLAERIRQAVIDHPFEVGSRQTVSLTCSIGFSAFPFIPSQPKLVHWEQVVGIADRALYVAKQSGRNQWVGILSTDKTEGVEAEGLHEIINERPEQLAYDGLIELRTSIGDPDAVVWARA
jgi:diguanylate cyclase (GGDEF)-like protein